jgi:hypothetical protein
LPGDELGGGQRVVGEADEGVVLGQIASTHNELLRRKPGSRRYDSAMSGLAVALVLIGAFVLIALMVRAIGRR